MRVTYYGYFGPTTNVRDARLDDRAVANAFALIDQLPRRVPVPRAPDGAPLRFIPVADLPGAPQ